MSSTADDFRKELIARAANDPSLIAGFSLYTGFDPANESSAITFYDVPGIANSSCETLQTMGVLVKVRTAFAADSYELGYNAIMRIRQAFDTRFSSADFGYSAIWISQDAASLGQDENKNFQFSIAFMAQRDRK